MSYLTPTTDNATSSKPQWYGCFAYRRDSTHATQLYAEESIALNVDQIDTIMILFSAASHASFGNNPPELVLLSSLNRFGSSLKADCAMLLV